MGIRGLTTYINRNPKFMEDYNLHGGYIVIDGLALASHLFFSTYCNCSFGGDYDMFASYISNFFDDLHKCQVTALVIMDGGTENRKSKTVLTRHKERMELLASYTPASEATVRIGPNAIETVFLSVVKQKRVKVVRCPFEADASTAAVAKVLNCPVLSLDSDFYIFGVNYVPADSFSRSIADNPWGRGYVKPCKIFRPQYLLRSFPGLDLSALPLAAVLLGNDYVKRETFDKFFERLEISAKSTRLYSIELRRIDATLRWLRNFNLNDAVAAVLGELPKKDRPKVLDAIESTIDGYLNLPSDMLLPLGFATQYHAEMKATSERKSFKFQGDVDALTSKLTDATNETIVEGEHSSSTEEEEEETPTSTFCSVEDFQKRSDEFVRSWPPWFAYHYTRADFPSHFVGMMFHRTFCSDVQVEDFNCPSTSQISMKLVRTIDGLLVAGREESDTGLVYIIRDGSKLVARSMKTLRGTRSTVFPALRDLRDTPIETRKQIFYDTLNATGQEKLIEEIPGPWRLYIAAAIYWMRQAEDPPRNWLHMRSLLFTMLMSVLNRKVGHCRSMFIFDKKYRKILADMESEEKSAGDVVQEKEDESMTDAFEAVTVADCLLVTPFFISHCQMAKQLRECPDKFNVTIVHVFGQFQTCMMHIANLSSLLGLAYEQPMIEELFNGTMLYNLYVSFEMSCDVDSYITEILQKSPSLLRLLSLLTVKVREMLNTAPGDAEIDVAAA